MDAEASENGARAIKEQIVPIEGLKIRRAEADDYEQVCEMFASAKVYEGTLQVPYPSREYWRKRISENTDSVYRLVAIIDDGIVGMVDITTFPNRPRRKHVGAIGICVHADWQGKGLGTELMRAIVDLADNWLNLTRLELQVYTDNEAAIHLYERFGFEVEGTLRQHAFRDGRYVDSTMMGRLRPGSLR
ncbi:MAG TPA: GNAT family N-acetyltransferase [Pyrinomonadaceae bacterium]|nr:GNAT family N-acetyltransferase [Pyrinomonadaceae bacterium]